MRPAHFVLLLFLVVAAPSRGAEPGLSLEWAENFLTIRGPRLPADGLRVHYLEAYCRPGSTDRDWRETVIGHRTEVRSRSADGKQLELRCRLNDGVEVEHVIVAGDDEVDFQLTAHNPTKAPSLAHWAQPCIRVDTFTGKGQEDYLPACFVFLEGKLTRLPTQPWATRARYEPGQVYCPAGVDRNDVNPRPLSELAPSHGLIGCFSADGETMLASAWSPYQELFQGVVTCVHSDFRLGGLAPQETKKIHGKIYVIPADADALLERYRRDFAD